MTADHSPNWKALTDNMGDGLVVIDHSGCIRFTNRAASELLQRTGEELMGYPFGHPAVDGESATINLLTHDGRMLTAHLRSAEIEWEDAPAWLVVIHDVTELLRRQREVEELNQKLAEQVTCLEQFSYMVAHDLRAPVRAVSTYAQILQEDYTGSLPSEVVRIAQHIQAKCTGMEELIAGVLAFARSTVEPLKMKPVDLTSLVKDVINGLEHAEPRASQIVKIEPLPEVLGDSQLLVQVFGNLLSNALKYSSTVREPAVRVYSSQRADWQRISVSDNGMGFSPEEAKRIFNVFTRLNPQQQNGIGVGLAIVRNIVLRHGGNVWAEGEKGKGATFHLELPLAARL